MTARRSAREKKAGSEAGPLARVKIEGNGHKQFVYKISCSVCVVRGHLHWSAYRPGGDDGFMAAMDRWVFHLNEKHPGADAPCMAFLSAAQRRLHKRREEQDADPTALGSWVTTGPVLLFICQHLVSGHRAAGGCGSLGGERQRRLAKVDGKSSPVTSTPATQRSGRFGA